MSNYAFNFNNLNNLDAPDQNSWFDGSINNSFSSNNASSSLSSNLSANSTSLSGNLCSNFTLNTHQNGNPSNQLNGSPSPLTNGLSNGLGNGLNNGLSNGLTNNNNFGNSYYCDYQAYNSSSNSSSIALNSEYDYNQQNLVTNLGESNLNSNAIPPFYPTFSQGVSGKEPPANHQLNSHRIDSLIGASTTNLLSSNSSVGSCGSLYQLSAPPINLQATNHHAPFNHVQNSFLVAPNLQGAESLEHYRSPEHSNSPYSYLPDSVEELKYDAFSRQLPRQARPAAEAVDDAYVDFHNVVEDRRRANNQRERARVEKLNLEFCGLGRTVQKVANSSEPLTKHQTLVGAYNIITDLECQVNSKLQRVKKGGSGLRDPPI